MTFRQLVTMELTNARKLHGPIRSRHEGYAVILEEVRELEEVVFRRKENITTAHLVEELTQVAAMAQRMAEDLNLVPADQKAE